MAKRTYYPTQQQAVASLTGYTAHPGNNGWLHHAGTNSWAIVRHTAKGYYVKHGLRQYSARTLGLPRNAGKQAATPQQQAFVKAAVAKIKSS